MASLASAKELKGSQKAAVLMIALGDEHSAAVFKCLDEEEIQTLSKEIALMKHVQPELADQVVEEFHVMAMAKKYITQGGIEYARKVLIKSVGPDMAKRIVDRLTRALEASAGFTSLERANPQQLAKFIQNEHPQTIALIMAHLDATHGAEVLTALKENLRADVAMRMANLEEISPQVIRRISMILEQKLEAIGGFSVEDYGGIRAVAELFNRMERNTGKQVLEKIEGVDPKLAADIRELMFVFDDIILIDDAGITEILKRVDRKVLSYALKGTSEEVQAVLYRNMSSRAAEMLKEECEYLGAVKLKEVEKAQHQVVEVIRQLEEEGIIQLGGGAGEEYVS
jgi:flagellar motor switch protein FliG